jgi:hypothetical protein
MTKGAKADAHMSVKPDSNIKTDGLRVDNNTSRYKWSKKSAWTLPSKREPTLPLSRKLQKLIVAKMVVGTSTKTSMKNIDEVHI